LTVIQIRAIVPHVRLAKSSAVGSSSLLLREICALRARILT
jgi:hypothetical protein